MEQRFTDPNAMTQAGLNLIQQALSIYNKDLELALCNQRHGEMFNLPKSLTTPGAKFEDTIRYLVESGEYGDVENAEAFIQEKVDIAKAFKPHYVERIRANGQVISIEGAPLPQGGWVTVYTDITQTKKQENLLRLRSEELSDQLLSYSEELAAKNRQLESSIAALEEAKRELTEIESRTRLTSEMIPAHVAHVDRQGRYRYSNRRLSMVLPDRPNDIIGRHISEVLGAPTYNQILPKLREAFLGTPSVLEFTDDLSARRIRVAFTPDVKETGIEGAYILSMDITEETQARNALQQVAKRELAAQLTSGLAHDFSNLLTIILGAQSRLTGRVHDAESLALIEATKTAATRGGSLLNTIGDMTGTRNLNPTPTHIEALLEKLLPLAEAALPKSIILKIHNTVPDEAYFLDSGILQDALLNLILNAKDACGAGGRIKLSIRPVADIWLDFIVTDSGSGFSAKALKHALDPFYTTKGLDGNGLGLTMVYDAAKLAGGDLRLSNSFSGARAQLRLPLRKVPAMPHKAMVLIVEDDPSLRKDMRVMLTDLGHLVIEASSVSEALDLCQNLPDIALILCDLNLEGDENGTALAKARPHPSAELIFMTSLPIADPLHQDALTLAPVLSKPFSQRTLETILSGGPPL